MVLLSDLNTDIFAEAEKENPACEATLLVKAADVHNCLRSGRQRTASCWAAPLHNFHRTGKTAPSMTGSPLNRCESKQTFDLYKPCKPSSIVLKYKYGIFLYDVAAEELVN